jgi:alpha-mannosidase
VNDILDQMTHVERHGDFVNSNFTDTLPDYVKNFTQQKRRKELLSVIVVPHSHNDPGYKKTFSEYFHESTSNILSLLIEKLYQYNDATFVWPESCLLERWWTRQNKSTKIKFKRLVESGRLEITSGAWVIPDEATPHYFAYLDQMIEGHFWVKQHLGVIPITSFDMDQFGYSSTARFLMDKAGIKYSVLKRVHLGMKEYLMKMKLMNFYLKTPSDAYGKGHFVQVSYIFCTFHCSLNFKLLIAK